MNVSSGLNFGTSGASINKLFKSSKKESTSGFDEEDDDQMQFHKTSHLVAPEYIIIEERNESSENVSLAETSVRESTHSDNILSSHNGFACYVDNIKDVMN